MVGSNSATLDREDASARAGRRLKLCLAASGGGHVRQLLDLQPIWSEHDHFFVTEETALGQSLGDDVRTHFVPHFAWGQAKLGAPLRMLRRAVASAFKSFSIILGERPDVVISTGAGAVFFVVLFGRLLGARIIVVESFARFERPSLFGRLAGPLAHHLVVQSARLSKYYPKAKVFDPLKLLDDECPAKRDLLFATVGATLPFDRLVDSVAQLSQDGTISEAVTIQTGIGGRRPDGVSVSETLPFGEVQALLREASIVVCHGGTGSMITALRQGCHVIAMPRQAKAGEHYDDHQMEIVDAFQKRGLAMRADTVEDLREALAVARQRPRVKATTEPTELIAFLRGVMESVAADDRGARPAVAADRAPA
ncbi:MAG TPA: glycosyltransferase [Phenylobacterium sp.]|uniref:beta-1,4-glucuronosyltransferase WelK n=1 Tax=Phenylobacterium sp. TaxID=1871053 RepID=UPI002B4A574C|nr:glycosyltransferase [Phenylobacterium sp.]HKR87543.1 glycosyltransferase [Phenylobacterium sp.]